MTTKEAIQQLRDEVKSCPVKPVCYNCQCHEAVLDALRASQKAIKLMALNDSRIIGKLKQDARDAQKREREVFKRLSRHCDEQVGGGKLCTMNIGNAVPCTMRTCPLLAKQKKESK